MSSSPRTTPERRVLYDCAEPGLRSTFSRGCYHKGHQNQIGGLALKSGIPPFVPIDADEGGSSLLIAKFDRLIQDLITGQIQRSKFSAWEMEILLDFEACGLSVKHLALVDAYCEAVHRQIAAGAAQPLKFSEFLASRPSSAESPKTKRSA